MIWHTFEDGKALVRLSHLPFNPLNCVEHFYLQNMQHMRLIKYLNERLRTLPSHGGQFWAPDGTRDPQNLVIQTSLDKLEMECLTPIQLHVTAIPGAC